MTMKVSLTVATLIASCLAAPAATTVTATSVAVSSVGFPAPTPDVGLLEELEDLLGSLLGGMVPGLGKRQDDPDPDPGTETTTTDTGDLTTTMPEIMTTEAPVERRRANDIDEGLVQTLIGLGILDPVQ